MNPGLSLHGHFTLPGVFSPTGSGLNRSAVEAGTEWRPGRPLGPSPGSFAPLDPLLFDLETRTWKGRRSGIRRCRGFFLFAMRQPKLLHLVAQRVPADAQELRALIWLPCDCCSASSTSACSTSSSEVPPSGIDSAGKRRFPGAGCASIGAPSLFSLAQRRPCRWPRRTAGRPDATGCPPRESWRAPARSLARGHFPASHNSASAFASPRSGPARPCGTSCCSAPGKTHQRHDVFLSFPQRRQINGDDRSR